MSSRGGRIELEVGDAGALHFLHEMARLEKLVAQSVAAHPRKRDFIPGCVLAAKARDARAGGAREAFNFFEREKRLEFQLIRLWQIVRLQNAIREVAVICQKYQARGMVFEAPYRKNSLGDSVQKIP